MPFNSYIFIFAFLPFTLLGYYFSFKKWGTQASNLFLLAMSLLFYTYSNWKCLIILVLCVLINYQFHRFLRCNNETRLRKVLFVVALLLNIGFLGYFKYCNFFLESLNSLFKGNLTLYSILLPMGISFFTFQQISFLVDSYRKEITATSILDFSLYSFFFPSISSGPILFHNELVTQLHDRERKAMNYNNMTAGLYVFSLGLAKKVLLAQVFANAVNTGYDDLTGLGTTNALIITLAYTFQIYFDFSGYCDMALGIAKMLNFDLPINFDSPYQSYTITEFWSRWHITLTRFFTKYIYIPLGGNRRGKIHTYINILIIFLISGLWHGADITFIVWGCLHGIAMVITRIFKKRIDDWHPAFKWAVTFSFVSFAWIYFRAGTLAEAHTLIDRLLSLNFDNINIFIADAFNITEVNFLFGLFHLSILDICPHLMMIIFFALAFYIILCTKNNMRFIKNFSPSVKSSILTAVLLLWSLISFSGVNTFIYFTF